MRELVLTVHGINSKGAWQDDVASVLRPHFDVGTIRYPQYRTLGFAKQLVEPLAAAVAALLLVAAWARGSGWLWCVGAIAAAVAIVEPVLRRGRALRAFVRQYEEHTSGRLARPHLIAHSYGAFLTARSLRFAFCRFERLVFAGGAVSRSFDWSRHLDRRGPDEVAPRSARSVRNEVGGWDGVLPLARFLAPLIQPIGDAGAAGFLPGAHAVHAVAHPLGSCEHCERGERARVHDVNLQEYRHSDHFLSRRHARDLWLPALWGMSPQEHAAFLDACGRLARMDEEGLLAELADEEPRLLDRRWSWCRGKTFEEHLASQVSLAAAALKLALTDEERDDLADVSARSVWIVVAAARSEEAKPDEQRDAEKLRALDPRIAAVRAVRETLIGFSSGPR